MGVGVRLAVALGVCDTELLCDAEEEAELELDAEEEPLPVAVLEEDLEPVEEGVKERVGEGVLSSARAPPPPPPCITAAVSPRIAVAHVAAHSTAARSTRRRSDTEAIASS